MLIEIPLLLPPDSKWFIEIDKKGGIVLSKIVPFIGQSPDKDTFTVTELYNKDKGVK